MNPLLSNTAGVEQLHDIEGLDSISQWPLAIGWWVLIAIGASLGCAFVYYAVSWIYFKRSWKSDTLQKLAYLENNLSDTTAKETIIALSEYLRRIALRRYSRKECASLMGDAWLKWLSTHDPKQFDWENKGTLLINTPYAPLNVSLSIDQIKDLIQAVKNWVR